MTKPPLISGNYGKALGLELTRLLAALAARQDLTPEITYRLGKMRRGLLPLLDRLYLKTLKGQDMLMDCLKKVKDLEGHLPSPDDTSFHLLTDLEVTYEELLRTIYEFRVKAG